jgi:uncharacterized protein YutE (UPF0331/DUF86 family)
MDAALLEKKLAFIETRVRELKELARPERIASDVREARFVEHTLQIAIQAALDVASQIVSDRRLGEPETNRALFDLLQKAGIVSQTLAEQLYAMAGFRNVLVHGYQEADVTIVEDIVRNHLGDLIAFVAAIRAAYPSTEA